MRILGRPVGAIWVRPQRTVLVLRGKQGEHLPGNRGGNAGSCCTPQEILVKIHKGSFSPLYSVEVTKERGDWDDSCHFCASSLRPYPMEII